MARAARLSPIPKIHNKAIPFRLSRLDAKNFASTMIPQLLHTTHHRSLLDDLPVDYT
jgi:hypothetical protein